MNTGLLVILILAALGVVALLSFRKQKKSEPGGRYTMIRPGCAKFRVDPTIPRATAEGMADLVAAVYAEVFPFVRDTYAQAFRNRHIPLPAALFRWNLTTLEPGQMSDGRWTAWHPSTGTWQVSVGCTPHLLAEEIHSAIRARLGDDVYRNHSFFRVDGETVSSWIRSRYGE